MYLGARKNGLVRLGIALLSAIAVAAPIYAAGNGRNPSSVAIGAGVVGLVVLSFVFTSSYENARRGVVLWNERTEAEFNRAHPSAP